MRTPIFVAWLKYQWRKRRVKTVAGAIVAELDYINAQLSKLQRRKMDDTNVMRMAALFHRRNFLMTLKASGVDVASYSRSDYEDV